MRPFMTTMAIAATLAATSVAFAQTPEGEDLPPDHQWLRRMAGNWDFERQSVPTAGGTPEILGAGTIAAEMIGEYFVVSRWSGQLYGIAYEASQLLGYNSESQQYTGYWVDSFLDFRWELSGSVQDELQELVLATRGPAPGGGTTTYRERTRFDSPDAFTIMGEMQQGDRWIPLSVTRITRRP